MRSFWFQFLFFFVFYYRFKSIAVYYPVENRLVNRRNNTEQIMSKKWANTEQILNKQWLSARKFLKSTVNFRYCQVFKDFLQEAKVRMNRLLFKLFRLSSIRSRPDLTDWRMTQPLSKQIINAYVLKQSEAVSNGFKKFEKFEKIWNSFGPYSQAQGDYSLGRKTTHMCVCT